MIPTQFNYSFESVSRSNIGSLEPNFLDKTLQIIGSRKEYLTNKTARSFQDISPNPTMKLLIFIFIALFTVIRASNLRGMSYHL